MSIQFPNQLHTADISLKLPVEVDYGLDEQGETKIKSVRVVHGPLSMDINALLTEDDFFDIFVQLDDWYHEVS
jgi:hypothetical protein